MRKIMVVTLVLLQVMVNAQGTKEAVKFPVKGELVTVTNWGSRSIILIGATFFAETQDSIIAKIGEEEFEEMKTKCSSSGWPDGFYKGGASEEEDKAFEKKLNELKMYKIGSYTHKYNGNTFGRYAILRIPFEENMHWDPPMQWDRNVYFLLADKDVQPVK